MNTYVRVERQAERAQERYNELAPVFALLDAMDLLYVELGVELGKQLRYLDHRLTQLEKCLAEEKR